MEKCYRNIDISNAKTLPGLIVYVGDERAIFISMYSLPCILHSLTKYVIASAIITTFDVISLYGRKRNSGSIVHVMGIMGSCCYLCGH